MDLHCDLDTAVLIALNIIGWSIFLAVTLNDRAHQRRATRTTRLAH